MFKLIRKKLSQIFILECFYVFIVTLQEQGCSQAYHALCHRIKVKTMSRVTIKDYDDLEIILNDNAGKPIIVFNPLVNWHIPLYQRPQHVALQLASEGFLYFYCTDNSQYDAVKGFNRIADNCYITNRYEILQKLDKHKIIHLCSTDNRTKVELVEKELSKGNLILYEYIDEIHGSLEGIEVPLNTYIKHEMILKDERCIVIATADKLYRDVMRYRSKNCVLVTNGVEYEHFAQQFSPNEVPEEIRSLLAKGKPVIGYFGALASWFDYELVIKIARERPGYEILLIGWDFDKSLGEQDFGRIANVTILGPVRYQDLPRYACWFDVATIPFKLNEVTEATSPIKLFEYMALGHPIVTTGMPECRKYQSVLIGETHDDFISKLDYALTLRVDETFKALLKKEALENTWQAKARTIACLIRNNLNSNTEVV